MGTEDGCVAGLVPRARESSQESGLLGMCAGVSETRRSACEVMKRPSHGKLLPIEPRSCVNCGSVPGICGCSTRSGRMFIASDP